MTFNLRVSGIDSSYQTGAWYLDRPDLSLVDDDATTTYLELAGWITATTPDPVHAIVIYAKPLYRSPLLIMTLHPRADVCEAMGLAPDTPSGFHAHLNLLGLQHIGPLELYVVTAGGWDQFVADSSYYKTNLDLVATIHLDITTPTPEAGPPDPLFVTSLGRSGSTALMAALATNHAVAAPEAHPYESKPIAYALHMARLAVTPSIPHLPISSGQFLDVPFIASANPNLRIADYPKLFAHYQANGLAILRSLVLPQFESDPSIRYIAEKSAPNTLTAMTAELIWPGAVEIILFREVEPWIASALAFSEATGHYFGLNALLADLIPQIAIDLAGFLDYATIRAHRALFLRYEDLIAGPASLERLAARLNLTFTPAMADSLAQIPDSHRSTPTKTAEALAKTLTHPEIAPLTATYQTFIRQHQPSFI